MVDYEINELACGKILLHSAKFPSVAVNGVLLGRRTQSAVAVLDSVPMFHTDLNLAPMLEIALEQIEAYATGTNMRVLGYYQANQNPDDRTVSTAGKTIASLIESKTGAPTLYLVVDMAKFRTAEPPLVAYTKDGSNWTLLKGKLSVQNPPKRFLEDSSFSLLHDFDEHLESLDKDWLANGSAAKLIDAA